MPSSCDCTYSPYIRVYLRIDADGLADVIEAVPFQQFGKAAFQHGDLLWTAIIRALMNMTRLDPERIFS